MIAIKKTQLVIHELVYKDIRFNVDASAVFQRITERLTKAWFADNLFYLINNFLK